MNPLDETILAWANALSHPLFLQGMAIITYLGSSEFIILLMLITIIALIIFKRDWFNSIFILWLTVGGIVLNFGLKILFQRERPGEMSYIEVFGISMEIASYSFPSGHTMRSVLLFSFFIYLSYTYLKNTSLRLASYTFCLLLIIGVFLSRVILDAHFPTDIIAAICVSISWFFFSLYYLPKWMTKFRLTDRFR
ncbi:undecaprenyl-diphosphatase [Evansella vedderi]|uniref:Undecaprenyl-diphosphatase n=2 Tax=Evansella vedderi TaxID=38282 RepID=A0ABU0A1F2_9BACI|nr:undecaprenyl-diphosphatase [Evansella vedderi]